MAEIGNLFSVPYILFIEMEDEQHFEVKVKPCQCSLGHTNLIHLSQECYSHDYAKKSWEDSDYMSFYFADKDNATAFAQLYQLHCATGDPNDGNKPKKRKK